MRSLHALLIHKSNSNYRTLTGWWSTPVPQFTWETMAVDPSEPFSITVARGRYDLIVLDDWLFGDLHAPGLPVAYVVVDSMRSSKQFIRNVEQARKASIILCDSEDLTRIGSAANKPAIRFAHCVNRELFHPEEKKTDVGYFCWPTPERLDLRDRLSQYCQQRGYTFSTGKWDDPREYARAIRSARIIVHKPHVPMGRSWRVFDVLASKGCLLTWPIPTISGDELRPEHEYLVFHDDKSLQDELDYLLAKSRWNTYANIGYDTIMLYHTWEVRAAQLRKQLNEILGI